MNEQQITLLAQSAADYARTGRDQEELESLLAGQLDCYGRQDDLSKESIEWIEEHARAILGIPLGGNDAYKSVVATAVVEQASLEEPTGSDGDLERRITSYLNRRFPSVESVKVQVRAGTAVLRGSVGSLSVKFQCVECCRHVAGVLHVVDKMKIVVPPQLREGRAVIAARRPR